MVNKRRALRVMGLLLGVAIILSSMAFAALRRHGLSADRTPSQVEARLAQQLVRLSLPAAETARGSPVGGDAEAGREGAAVFRNQCVMCHGSDGRGRTMVGPRMYPPVPDLASERVQRFTDGELFALIRHGVSWTGMPAFRAVLSEEETWKLVAFVRSVPTQPFAAADDAARPAQDDATVRRIAMDGTQFAPRDITIPLGATVVWTNIDPFPHNVDAEGVEARSGDLAPGETWSFRPGQRGTFTYQCTLHPGMTGVLHVR